MRENIMAVLNEADRVTRELWGLCNEEEVAWESVYDEVRAGPAPEYMSGTPETPPRVTLQLKLQMVGEAMQRLAQAMEEKYGQPMTRRTTTHVATAGVVVGHAQIVAGPYNVGAQVFNPMWLLEALQFWLMQSYSLSEEQWAALLRQIGHDPLPYWLRPHRDDPELALFAMINSIAERLRDCAERRGYVAGRHGTPGSLPPRDLPANPDQNEEAE